MLVYLFNKPQSQTSPYRVKEIFDSYFGRENSYSIYSNVREFPSFVCRPFP
jgi:hypothetical protein